MSRSDQQRYDEALAYLKTVDAALAADVNLKLGPRAAMVGAEISLGGEGYWRAGTPQQHAAVRALLLCQIAYFRPPHCPGTEADLTRLTQTRKTYVGKPIAQVKAEIDNYRRPLNRSLNDVVNVARSAVQSTLSPSYITMTRADRGVGKAPVCYHGCTLFLFASGYVSKRWLGGPGFQITANNADTAFGQGQAVPLAQWAQIPAGHVWTVQRRNDPTTCHWGVSLGSGQAAATNNTGGSLMMMIDFTSGFTTCGTFDFVQMCTMLNSDLKYGNLTPKVMPATADANIVVKQINPAASTALF